MKREEELDRKFLTSGQEKVKLEIALMRYFELAKDKNKDFLSEMEQTYQNYLLNGSDSSTRNCGAEKSSYSLIYCPLITRLP